MDASSPTFICIVCTLPRPYSHFMTRHLNTQSKTDVRCATNCCLDCALELCLCPMCGQFPVILHNTEGPFVWRCISTPESRSYKIVRLKQTELEKITDVRDFFKMVAGPALALCNVDIRIPDAPTIDGEVYTFMVK